MDAAEDLERITRALDAAPLDVWPAPGHAAPSNRRWLVRTARGRAFVKIAAFDYTAEWLRLEHRNYAALQGLACMPTVLGWDDDGTCPALAIEDLADAEWPPPWTASSIDAVRAAIDEVAGAVPPGAVRSVRASEMFDLDQGWRQISDDPGSFLGLGVCSAAWLERHLGTLQTAAEEATIDGDTLLHGDIRSDNLCLRAGRAVLVDWNWLCVGHDDLDLAAWLPSLADEGGPDPWTILPGRGALASRLAGFFLEHARLGPIPQAPHVRRLQLDQGRVALSWAAHELGIEPPG